MAGCYPLNAPDGLPPCAVVLCRQAQASLLLYLSALEALPLRWALAEQPLAEAAAMGADARCSALLYLLHLSDPVVGPLLGQLLEQGAAGSTAALIARTASESLQVDLFSPSLNSWMKQGGWLGTVGWGLDALVDGAGVLLHRLCSAWLPSASDRGAAIRWLHPCLQIALVHRRMVDEQRLADTPAASSALMMLDTALRRAPAAAAALAAHSDLLLRLVNAARDLRRDCRGEYQSEDVSVGVPELWRRKHTAFGCTEAEQASTHHGRLPMLPCLCRRRNSSAWLGVCSGSWCCTLCQPLTQPYGCRRGWTAHHHCMTGGCPGVCWWT